MIIDKLGLRRLRTKTAQWTLSAFLALAGVAGVAGVSSGETLSGLLLFLVALVCTPLANTFYKKLLRQLPLWVRGVVVLALLVGAAATATPDELPAQEQNIPSGSNEGGYAVTAVSDGDTIKVLIDGKTETIRLVNINTPESVDPRRPVECLGVEAGAQMKALVEGRRVRLETDPTQGDRDRYGRLLRFVLLEEGTDVGLEMIHLGYAYSTPYGKAPHPYLEEYNQAQRQAQAEQRGLWDTSLCPGEPGREESVE